jgi:hypothetical protein
VEGTTTKLGDSLHVIPSLEVVRDDSSLLLTIENQGTTYAEIDKGLVVAQITNLPGDDADRGGESTAESTDSTSAPYPNRCRYLNTRQWAKVSRVEDGIGCLCSFK